MSSVLALLSRNGRKTFHLSYPSSNRVQRKTVYLKDSNRWTPKGREQTFTLDGRLAANEGRDYYFDMERGVQVGPPRLSGEWEGIDAFETFQDNHDDRFNVINRANRLRIEKYLKYILYGVLLAVGTPIACLVFLLQKI